ncbi:MAG: hypothetical protein KMY53_02215 [Desulfarculus sp.]|nr:hypothetical protein [Pseudomonadota bacterium]MBV1717336.1 hypothetical protein [Desulfarculus sp.]MBU4572985.1 hypothetical protein [Pseudomonadota bacterium]MBU4596923.1 hypothetical protein [Pseudomonadota bacterium]MBV1736954.1 hypothetical protein [Desulfarculus sp.]
MKRSRMWLGLLAVFACGLVIGGLSASIYERHQAAERYRLIRQDKGAFLTQLILDRLDDTLELSAAQKARIQPLLLEAFRRSLKLREQVRPQQEQIIRETTGQLQGLLTPAQVKKLADSGEWKLLMPRPPK